MVFLMFLIGEGLENILRGEGKDLLPFLPFLFLAIIGYFLTWNREYLGGILAIIGGVAMAAFHLVASNGENWIIAIVYGAPYLVSGVISLIVAIKTDPIRKLPIP